MKLRWLLLTLLVLALLVPAGALTYARMLDPAGGAWVRVVAFTPLALGLYLVALLVLLLAGWRAGGAGRVLARTLAVGCVAGLLLHAFWASGPYVGTSVAEAGGRHTLRVMTANLYLGQADPSRVVEAAVAHGVDVLVLQEVTPSELGGMEAAGLGTAYPHRVGGPADGAGGTMVLSTRPLSHARRVPTRYGSWSVDVASGAGVVHLLAVHARPPVGDAKGWAADQVTIRSAAMALDGPTVLVGDFNATLDHRPMRELVGRGFDDAVVQARSRWEPTWPSAGQVSVLGVELPSLLQLDHVLVNRALHVVATMSVAIDGTDHRAVVAVLR
ncbi:MAG: endonuclease/exonuclease/phosphatase family protein [Nocardioidaceae bacterium]